MSNTSIWPIDRTLSGATNTGQTGPGSDGNKGVLCIPQSSSITQSSPSDTRIIKYVSKLFFQMDTFIDSTHMKL